MERRTFLMSGLPALAAARVRAAGPVRLAVLGRRGRGAGLAAEFAGLPGARITYVCDPDSRVFAPALKSIEAAGAPRPRVAADFRATLDSPDVDAVVIATPDHWHAPATLMACAAGKDVYVEKPASHNFREGEWMVAAARRHQRIVQVGTQARSHPAVQEAIEYLRGGKLGQVLQAKALNVQRRDDIGHREDSSPPADVDYDLWTGPAALLPFNENRFHYKWHWNWNYGTGDAGNDGVHQLDVARWALDAGLPERVTGSAGKLHFKDDQQTPDTMNISFLYPGRSLLFEMRIWAPYGAGGLSNAVEVYGSEGMMQIGTNWFKVFDPRGKEIASKAGQRTPFGHARDFIDAVRTRRSPNAEIEIGHLSSGLAHLANIVARTGREIRFDARKSRIVGDAEANRLLGRAYRPHWARPEAPEQTSSR